MGVTCGGWSLGSTSISLSSSIRGASERAGRGSYAPERLWLRSQDPGSPFRAFVFPPWYHRARLRGLANPPESVLGGLVAVPERVLLPLDLNV